MILSKLRPLLSPTTLATRMPIQKTMSGGHNNMVITPSRWQWNKFKDTMHFYLFLGAIPCIALSTYANVFIGPATLSEIPEGYVPRYWEYYRNPVTRFIARYMSTDPQQEYEKFLSYVFMEREKIRMREVEALIKENIRVRGDYQAYYYRPVLVKYARTVAAAYDYVISIRGD